MCSGRPVSCLDVTCIEGWQEMIAPCTMQVIAPCTMQLMAKHLVSCNHRLTWSASLSRLGSWSRNRTTRSNTTSGYSNICRQTIPIIQTSGMGMWSEGSPGDEIDLLPSHPPPPSPHNPPSLPHLFVVEDQQLLLGEKP